MKYLKSKTFCSLGILWTCSTIYNYQLLQCLLCLHAMHTFMYTCFYTYNYTCTCKCTLIFCHRWHLYVVKFVFNPLPFREWYHASAVFLLPLLTQRILSALYDLSEVTFDLPLEGVELDEHWPSFALWVLLLACLLHTSIEVYCRVHDAAGREIVLGGENPPPPHTHCTLQVDWGSN